MSIEENKALVRHAFELVNRKELDAFFELLDPAYVAHYPIGDFPLEQAKHFETMYFAAFPDANATIEDMAAGDCSSILIDLSG